MKKLIILIVLLFAVLSLDNLLYAQDTTIIDTSDTLTAEEVSLERGYVTAIYHIYKEDVLPWYIDYADSTVLFWYPDNKETGILYFDMRSKNWVGLPIMDEPNQKCIWRRQKITKNKQNKE